MLSIKIPLALALLCLSEVLSASQAPLSADVSQSHHKKLRGRFLQITDIHPDPHYTYKASMSSSCHRMKPKKEKPRAGYYGTPFSVCDSPLILSNFTLDFLDKHWAGEIDFVIWTGDNARHDNDHKIPRTTKEIYDLNRAMARKMEEVFVRKGIPVVPSLGNNDVWPHNIMAPGPNSVTYEFSLIWSSFIPFPSYQVFQRGAYYSVEVIPGSVAAVALNTMYFYDSNKAVGGCEYTDPEDPGNLEFDWLEVQLRSFRSRNMQVWISGHVPPTPGNYFPECFVRYAELSLRFQDTILGHLFGHMNIDHFFFLEAGDLSVWSQHQSFQRLIDTSSVDGLYDDLLHDFDALRKMGNKLNYDDFAVINVSPSVVSNPYLPSFRIFSYNITGAERPQVTIRKRKHGHRHGGREGEDKEKECKGPKRNTWKCNLNEPWHSDPDAPSRNNTLWSPLGFAQYHLPDLDSADENHEPKFKLEYLTFPPSLLHPPATTDVGAKHQYPLPLRNLPRSLRDATITKSKYAPYHLPDLTIPSWIQLARRLAKPKHQKLRERFKKYMYSGGKAKSILV